MHTYSYYYTYKYGTHQLQLKHDTHVPRVCRTRNAHELLLHACIFVCFYFLPHENVRKYTSYVYMYTCFFAHAYACHSYTRIHTGAHI